MSQNTYNNIIREIVKYRPEIPETWTSTRQLSVECGKHADFRILFMEGEIVTSDDVTDVMRS